MLTFFLKGNIMARLTVAQMEAALKAAGHEISTELELGAELGLATAKLEQWLSAKAEATKVKAEGFVHVVIFTAGVARLAISVMALFAGALSKSFKVGYAYQRTTEAALKAARWEW
jgi:hypothetical protein